MPSGKAERKKLENMTQIMKRNYEKPTTTLIMLDNCLNLLEASPYETQIPVDQTEETEYQW